MSRPYIEMSRAFWCTRSTAKACHTANVRLLGDGHKNGESTHHHAATIGKSHRRSVSDPVCPGPLARDLCPSCRPGRCGHWTHCALGRLSPGLQGSLSAGPPCGLEYIGDARPAGGGQPGHPDFAKHVGLASWNHVFCARGCLPVKPDSHLPGPCVPHPAPDRSGSRAQDVGGNTGVKALNFPPLSFVCCLTNRSAALCIDCRVIIR